MKKLMVVALMAMSCWAQTTATDAVRIVEVKNGDPASIAQALFGVFPGLTVSGRMIVGHGQAAMMDALEDAVKKLDTPKAVAANLEITVQLLYGSNKADAAGPIPCSTSAASSTDLSPRRSARISRRRRCPATISNSTPALSSLRARSRAA